MGLKQNTWSLDQWYGQIVAGNVSYSGQGALYTWGDNEVGGLGNSSTTNYSSPIQILGTTWPKDGNLFSAGYKGCTAIKTDGTLWAWGYNGYGQLGQNNGTEYSSPKQVPGTTWATVTAGQEYTMATKTDGTLWLFGRNYYGQLGQNENQNYYSSPRQIPGSTWKTDVQLGSHANAAMAVKTDGTLWGWGRNNVGNLAQNNRADYSSPVQVPGTTWSHCVKTMKWGAGGIKTDGTLWMWGSNQYGQLGLNNLTYYSSPVQIPGSTWSYCATNNASGLAMKTDGSIWVWGSNDAGVLGQNQPYTVKHSSPIQVPGTWSDCNISLKTMFATKPDGTLWGWGSNGTGELGQNEVINYSSPIQIPGSWAAAASGGYFGTGQNIMGIRSL